MKDKTIELLAPAGSYESFLAAIGAGADAVYVGGSRFGARAYARNFSEEELLRAIDYAHLFGKKVYLTVNTLMKEQELQELPQYLLPYYRAGLDAVIVQDIGAIAVIKKQFPKLEVHASTQMAITSVEGVQLLESLGIRQVVPARELSLAEIRQITQHTEVRMECFIHGAICYSYSGKCLFSSLIGGRSGNRGRCAQPCRLPYDVMQEKRQLNDEREQYVLSMKDMCTIELLPQMIEAGISSFKIEGRMKRPEYVAGVTRLYRKYIDLFCSLREGQAYRVSEEDYQELVGLYTRSGSCKGYYLQKNGRDMLTLQKPNYETDHDDRFQELYEIYIQQRKKFPVCAEAVLRKNEPAILRLSTQSTSIEVSGGIVEQSVNRPLNHEDVKKQLYKTGNTDILFSELQIEADEDIFMPVKQLNDLRRKAIECFTEELLAPYRRDAGNQEAEKKEKTEKTDESISVQEPALSVYVESKEVLKSLCRIEGIRRVYLSYADLEQPAEMIDMAVVSGKTVYLALPVICRRPNEEKVGQLLELLHRKGVAGAVVQNYEWLYLLRKEGYAGEILADFYLYTMNREAKEQLRTFGCKRFTVPLELNEHEIRSIDRHDSELIVYGYLPMMVTAQCITNTMNGCQHREQKTVSLRDRYQKKLHVKNCCSECYNIIYNSVPLSLHNEMKKIRTMGFEGLRLNFTTESPETAVTIAEWYVSAVSGTAKEAGLPFTEFTKGHFARGVE